MPGPDFAWELFRLRTCEAVWLLEQGGVSPPKLIEPAVVRHGLEGPPLLLVAGAREGRLHRDHQQSAFDTDVKIVQRQKIDVENRFRRRIKAGNRPTAAYPSRPARGL